jgi:accessory colonization factor AcfC
MIHPTLITIPKADICKAEIAQIAQQLTDRINEGEVNPIEAHIKLKAIVKALEATIKATEDIVRDEAEKHGKTFSAFGAEIQVKEGALTPDYSHDQVWSDLQASMKAREELLKMAFRNAGKATVYDEATGEAVPVCPAKGTKPSISVTFKTT